MGHHQAVSHGGMNMPSDGPICNMNVMRWATYITQLWCLLAADAIHMGLFKSLYHFSTMAHFINVRSSHVTVCRDTFDSWLRIGSRD